MGSEQRSYLYRLDAPDQAVLILTERTDGLERLLRIKEREARCTRRSSTAPYRAKGPKSADSALGS